MKIDKYAFKYLSILSEICKKYWHVDSIEIGKLISKYKLFDYINENLEYLDMFSEDSIANIIKEEIERQGGSING